MAKVDIDRAYHAALILSGIIIVGLVLGVSAGEEGVGVFFLYLFIPMLVLAPVVLLISGTIAAIFAWKAWRVHRQWQLLVLTVFSAFAGFGPVLWVALVVFVAKDAILSTQYIGYLLFAYPAFVVPAAVHWFRTKRLGQS